MQVPSFFIIPSLSCQASCKYCFGPHRGAVMDELTARESIVFIRSIAEETQAREISVTFHGGEPLLAPLPVWQTLLGEVRTQLCARRVKLNVQSNLWNLTDELLQLFVTNDVSIGTSIDGPKEFCDTTRGEGYFDRTWSSVCRARAAGCSVGAIATIARPTLPHTQDIVKFFRNNGLSLILHGALNAMHQPDGSSYALAAAEYAAMVRELYPWYVANSNHIRIDTLDHFVRGAVTGQPGVCTLRNCFGMFLSIAPTGDITSCQRLAGKPEFSLGNIFSRPSLARLYESAAAQRQLERERQAGERCAACEFQPICRGGCYYNALASGDGVIDPWCEAYKSIYTFVYERLQEEMQSEENIAAIAQYPAAGNGVHPLLRKGAYTSLSGKVHPTFLADNARRVLAIYELTKTRDPHLAAQNLYDRQICGEPAQTEALLARMQADIQQNHQSLNNCYLHVTFNCNLRCTHCYAEAGGRREEMTADRLERLTAEAVAAGFRQIVITGGEPLMHAQRDRLFAIAKACRGKGTNMVLRTNLTGHFTDTDFRALAESFDQVVASVDGNEATHNARRGKGAYQNLTRNLEAYARLSLDVPRAAELSLACVMRADDVNGEPGQSVRHLGERLNVKRVRFRPLLPLGRAAQLSEPVICEGLMQHVSPDEMLQSPFHPLKTCGIGQNIFIRPDGRSYPCYAWCGDHTCIGNVFRDSLRTVLALPAFTRLAACTVDTIAKCRDCDYRYFCGGACRAWGNQQALDLNAAPPQCKHLQKRAEELIEAAKRQLGVKMISN